MWKGRKSWLVVEFGHQRQACWWSILKGPWTGLLAAAGALMTVVFVLVLVTRLIVASEATSTSSTRPSVDLRGVSVACAYSWREHRLVEVVRALQIKGATESGWGEVPDLFVTAGTVTGEICVLANDHGTQQTLSLLAAGASPQDVADLAAEQWLVRRQRLLPAWDLSHLGAIRDRK